jgi:hypothetical protein
MSSKPISTLKELVGYENQNLNTKLLPICHTFISKNKLVDMFSDKCLKSEFCDQFNKNLIYFFYGRAVYTKEEVFKDQRQGKYPYTFIYTLTDINHDPVRMFPFDSGAFKRYDIQDMDRNYFEISNPTKDEIKNYIEKLYGTNANYLSKKITIQCVNYPICLPLHELNEIYKKLHEPSSPKPYGDQAYTLELQYEINDLKTPPNIFIMPITMSTKEGFLENLKTIFPDSNFIFYDSSDTRMDILYRNLQKAVDDYIITIN